MNKTLLGLTGALLIASTGAQAQTISIGSNPQGSTAYIAAAGVAKVVNEATKLKMRVVPQGGPVITLPMVNKGDLDFSIAVSLVAAFGQTGAAMFKGKAQENVRVAAVLFPLHLGPFVRKDSKYMTLADVKGARMSSKLTKQKVALITALAMLATANIKQSDMVGVPAANGTRMVDDFMAGKIDVVLYALSSGKTSQANAKVGIRVLSLPNSADALMRMRKIAPGSIIETVQPGPKYPGMAGPTNVFSMPFILTAGAKVSDEMVYKVVTSLAANKKKLVASHKVFGGMDPKKMNTDLGIPYHPGAIKFYKEMSGK
jgi:uncharacterized protein